VNLQKKLKRDEDFTLDEKSKAVILTDDGISRLEKMLGIENLYDPKNIHYLFHALNALKALHYFKRDKDYIIQDGEVIIVD
jgi:preprotein translocase subunit SecA